VTAAAVGGGGGGAARAAAEGGRGLSLCRPARRIAEEEEAKAKREARVAERADESRQLLVQIVQQEEAGPSQPVDRSEV